jgi:hypothetical protein
MDGCILERFQSTEVAGLSRLIHAKSYTTFIMTDNNFMHWKTMVREICLKLYRMLREIPSMNHC